MAQLRVAGTWLATIGAHGGLRDSTILAGPEQLSWRMQLPETFTHPSLRNGALVERFEGPWCTWSGLLSEPETSEEGWSFTAIGFYDELDSAYLCFDGSLNTTSIPDTAIDQAIARGLPCTRPASLSSTPFSSSTTTDSLNWVGDLLDAWADSQSKRWRVNADRTITAAADPTTPTWYMTPGSARIGLADDDYASNLYLRYKTSGTTYATVAVADTSAAAKRRREYPVDATTLGVTTSTNVTNIGNGMIAKGKARYAWTDPATPSRLQLTTVGGQPAYLPFVKAGDMVRTFGVFDEQGTLMPYFDWIIGRTEYEEGADTITLAPVDLAARDLGDVLSLAVS